MAELIASRSVTLNAGTPRLQSPTLDLGALTSTLMVTLKRPTTAQPLSWTPSGRLRITLVLLIDGVEHRCVGTTSGGVRTGKDGQEGSTYTLSYTPTVCFGQKARDYIATAVPDAEGFYLNVPLSRIGETGTTVQGYLLLERISGTINTVITVAVTTEAPAPILAKYKNSVAFDAATDAQEIFGDGVLSVSHTASGSDRAAFIGAASSGGDGGKLGSATYGGSAATELWDNRVGAQYHTTAGYSFVAPAASAATVTSTLTAGPDEHTMGVITMTGVDQTTPTGNTQKTGSTTGNGSVTVTGVATDDMVVDHLVTDATSITIGADQTQRNVETITGHDMRMSSQPGSAGGVMSWTLSSFFYGSGWELGAVVFKSAAVAGRTTKNTRGFTHGVEVGMNWRGTV